MKKSKNINKSLTRRHSYPKGGTPDIKKFGDGYASLATTALDSGMDLYNATNSGSEYSQMAEPYNDMAGNIANTQYEGSEASLLKASAYNPSVGYVNADDFGGKKDLIGSIGKGLVSGAMAGAATANPYIIAASALGNAVLQGFSTGIRNENIDNQVNATNERLRRADALRRLNLDYAIQNEDTMSDRMRLRSMMNNSSQLGYAAFGGMLDTNGTDWETGATYIDNGSTHQNNPFGGVQYGVASDGLPNLVEEGEVVIKVKNNQEDTGEHSYAKGGPMYSDYVLSNRVIPTIEELAFANITDNPSKYEGQPYAQIYKDLTKGLKETINSPITKNYLDILHTRIARAQEDTKLREQQEEFMAELKKATPEQQDIILQQMGYNNPLEEATMAAEGGKIYIKPENRGKFTASAKRAGMGVQEFARHVLANKENYSSTQVKRANFARNFGGHKHQWGGWNNQEELAKFYQDEFDKAANLREWNGRTHDYFRGAGARQWIANLEAGNEQQRALADMLKNQWGDANLDWSPNATWEFKNVYSPKGTIVESSPYITWAGDNDKMKDALWGRQHIPQLSVDNRYQTPTYIQINDDGTFTELETPGFEERIVAGKTPLYPQGFTPESGKNYKFYYPEGEDNFTNLLNQISTSQNTNTDVEEDDIIEDKERRGIGTDAFLPIMSALANIKGVRPDNSNARLIEKSVLPPRYVGYNPTGRYVQPVLTDTRLISSALNNQNNNILNAIADLSGTNIGQAMANIIGQNYLNQQNIGEARLKANTANYETLKDAAKINNEIDFNNAQMALNADEANQRAWDSYAGRFAQQRTTGAKMREDTANAVTAAQSANWNNLLENIQAVMDNQRNRTMANDSLGRMYGYNIASNGSITFNNNNNKKKFAEDYNINIKDVDKVRRRRRNGVTKFYLNGKELTRKGE